MKILISGGTGFIGGHLVKKLISKDHCVFCLARDPQKAEVLRNLGATVIVGDIRDGNFIERLPQDIDLVYHLAGVLWGKWNTSNQVYYDVHIIGTENLLRVCVKLKIKRFIHCSSVGVLGPTGNTFFDESFPYHSTNIYAYTKAEAEKLVLAYARENKIDATVIRPAVVYGPGDFHMLGFLKAIKKGLFPLIDSGKALFQPVYIEDVIQGFESCINNNKTINQIYILAGNKPVTRRDFANMIAGIMGVRPSRINIPYKMANFVALMLEIGGKMFRFEPPFTRVTVKFLTNNYTYKINKAAQDLGYKPIDLEEGLKKTIEWYQINQA